MNEHAKDQANSRTQAIAFGITFFIWLVHFLPFVFPQARLWGISHLRFLPTPYVVVYAIGGAAVMLLFLPKIRNRALHIYSSIANLLFEREFPFRWLALGGLALIVFWLARLPIYLLGDSYAAIENIGNDLPVIFKWTEVGAIYLAYGVSRILPMAGSDLGQFSYNLISVLSGGATIFILCALAYELGRDPVGRLFFFSLAVFTGWLVLFLGYTENYPVLWPFISAYIYFSVRYIQRKGSLLWPTLMLVLAIVLHLVVLFFLISYPILLIARGKTARIYHSYRPIILVVAGLLAVSAMVIMYQLYTKSLEMRLFLLPVLEGRSAMPDYTVFSPTHVLDIVNQFILLVPLLPALIVLGWRGWRYFVQDRLNLFLSLISVGGLFLVFLIDPKLGMGRDWDLFAIIGLGPLVLFAKSIIESRLQYRALYPALTLSALLFAAPFVATNLSAAPSLDNYKYLLSLDLPKSRAGISILRTHYREQGDTAAVDSLSRVMVQSFPAVHLAPKAFNLAEQGKFAEAMILADSLAKIDPHSVETYNLRGTIYLLQGRYGLAVKNLTVAAELGRYDGRILSSLASAYNRLGQYDRMLETLRKGQQRNPDAFEIKEGLMTAYLALEKYDSAYVYASEVIAVNPDYPNAYFAAGKAAAKLGRKDEGLASLQKALELSDNEMIKKKAQDAIAEFK
jgi:tetratricopeptide (TPR) repeat protein